MEGLDGSRAGAVELQELLVVALEGLLAVRGDADQALQDVDLDEPELHFGDQVVVPDLGGWRRERLPTIPEAAFFTLAPDWVCEVLSPSTARFDRGVKLRVYAEAGVVHAWLVNPLDRTLEVLRLQDGAWTIVRVSTGSDVVRLHPFEAIELELGRLWPDAEAPPPSHDGG